VISKRSYTLYCSGCLESPWLAEFFQLFKTHQINIRKMVLIPAFEDIRRLRLEVEFELREKEVTFLDLLTGFLSPIANIHLFPTEG
jgi:hypothetical protein